MSGEDKLLGIGKITSSNRIPVTAILDFLNAQRGDHVKWVERENGDIVLMKV